MDKPDKIIKQLIAIVKRKHIKDVRCDRTIEMFDDAGVAQVAEQGPCTSRDAGSNPATGSKEEE